MRNNAYLAWPWGSFDGMACVKILLFLLFLIASVLFLLEFSNKQQVFTIYNYIMIIAMYGLDNVKKRKQNGANGATEKCVNSKITIMIRVGICAFSQLAKWNVHLYTQNYHTDINKIPFHYQVGKKRQKKHQNIVALVCCLSLEDRILEYHYQVYIFILFFSANIS